MSEKTRKCGENKKNHDKFGKKKKKKEEEEEVCKK